MCILIAKPANTPLPDYSALYNCYLRNPHGCGFAAPGLEPFKTLDFDEFCEALSRVDESEPLIIHFRYATHGSICRDNCHPFYDHYTGVAFAHNGILDIEPDEDTTDSETAFRRLFVPAIKKSGIHGRHLYNAQKNIRGSSKFAFLSDQGELIIFGDFINDKGIFYSNTSYVAPSYFRNFRYA